MQTNSVVLHMNVLVLNAGSSTLKFQVISHGDSGTSQTRLAGGAVDRFGEHATVETRVAGDVVQKAETAIPDMNAAVHLILKWLASNKAKFEIHAVGHRIVHGGSRFHDAALITDQVIEAIKDCASLAPLHNLNGLKVITAVREALGESVPQVAVFDTAYHHTLPPEAYLYGMPYEFYERHKFRRYGFHGSSYRYILRRYCELRNLLPEQANIIALHLGSGCSVCAIRGGLSIDTSMGISPLEGLVMGTRSGDIDPTLVRLIAEAEHISLEQVESTLERKSGLLGISGITNDMRELQMRTDERARLAIEVFCYRARKYIGAYLAAMGGADAIVFTGGIGENSPEIRRRICSNLSWAGLRIDEQKNDQAKGEATCISTEESSLAAYSVRTDEEAMIAGDTYRCVTSGSR